jgi:hypothetical protein
VSGCRPYPSECEFAEGTWSSAKRARTPTLSQRRGATPYCLPTVGVIVPVFGLALAPC